MRQHVNPLKSQYQTPTKAPNWGTTYQDPSLPLVVDIGCAAGRFLLELAEQLPGHNFLGLDIREPVSIYQWSPQRSYSLWAYSITYGS